MSTTSNKIIVIFFILLLTWAAGIQAQELDSIRLYLLKNELAAAKHRVDIYAEENTQDAVGLLLKAQVYVAISKNAGFKDLVADSRKIAFSALEKAGEIRSAILTEQLSKEQHQLAHDIYIGYTSDGIAFFNAGTEKQSQQDYTSALAMFKKAATTGNYIYGQGWGLAELDTSNLFYSALAAVYASRDDEAYRYCKKIADNNIVNSADREKDFEPLYKWLVYYLRKKNQGEILEKYTLQSAAAFPLSAYFYLNYVDWLRESKDNDRLFLLYKSLLTPPARKEYYAAYLQDLFAYNYSFTDSNIKPEVNKQLLPGLKSFIKTWPDDFSIRLLLAKYYINQAAGYKTTPAINRAKIKSAKVSFLNLSNNQLNIIVQKNKLQESIINQEALKLLINNYVLLGDWRKVNFYSKYK